MKIIPVLFNKNNNQNGVVLIIGLILLMVLSMISMFTIRQATSLTQVSNNARTQTTAMQAAEIALKTCETRVANFLSGGNPLITPRAAPAVGTPQMWEPSAITRQMVNWDGQGSLVSFPAVPPAGNFTLILGPNDVGTMLRRFPECMVEFKAGTTNIVIITARGFGPEVAAVDQMRSAPVGSEVWLQSNLTLVTP